MPIRFRCAYCNQLMGIARRKAGTVVRCPKCAGQVMVPIPENEEDEANELPAPPPPKHQVAEGGLFEQSDFNKVFEEAPVTRQPMPLAPPPPMPRPPAPTAGLPEYDAIPLAPSPLESGSANPVRGIFLTPGILAVVCALGVVLIGMAFFLGLLLGRSSAPAP
jgi:phage FluMu protein Com